MTPADAANVLLVRALEETAPSRIPPETLLEAHAAAGDPATGGAWIARRARWLVDHVLEPYRPFVDRSRLALPGTWPVIGVAAVVGAASNYLGPSRQIHVVWNPIVVLLAWNVAVYAVLGASRLRARTQPLRDDGPAGPAARRRGAGARPEPATGLADRLLFGAAIRWIARARDRVEAGVEDAKTTAAVGRRFARLWWPAMRPVAAAWSRRLLHLAAIGVTVGAVAGMYVRGLFFAYEVVWRSTFVNDPTAIGLVLALLLGPAALLLGQPVPGRDDALRMLGDAGDPAAPWIHLYGASALLVIVAPRALLAVAATRRLRRAAADVEVPLHGEYFRSLLDNASAVSSEKLQRSIRDAVEDERRRFSDRLVAFVARELYDGSIAPRLHAFRDAGGTIRALEAALQAECEAFGPVLVREMTVAQRELERALVVRIRRMVGDERLVGARPSDDLVRRVGAASSRVAAHVGEDLGDRVGTAIGAVVAASVAAAVGTVSGGFGEALGLALLAELGLSGPVGWVVGAIGALVAAGGALWLGRERLRDGVRSVPLPPAVLKVALWPGRWQRTIDEGRRRAEAAVREALDAQLVPLSAAIADNVWAALRPVVGELQRPRVSLDDPDRA